MVWLKLLLNLLWLICQLLVSYIWYHAFWRRFKLSYLFLYINEIFSSFSWKESTYKRPNNLRLRLYLMILKWSIVKGVYSLLLIYHSLIRFLIIWIKCWLFIFLFDHRWLKVWNLPLIGRRILLSFRRRIRELYLRIGHWRVVYKRLLRLSWSQTAIFCIRIQWVNW